MSKEQKQQSFFSSFVSGETSFGVWNGVSKVLNLTNAFIVIGFLSLYEFGVYQLVLATYGLVGSFFLKSLNGVVLNDIVRFVSEKKENYAKRLFYEFAILKIALGIILWLGLFFISDIIAGYYDENVAGFFRIISFLFLVDVVYSLIKILLQARLKFFAVALRPALHGVIRLTFLSVFILFLNFGIREILIIQLLSAFTATIIFLPLFWRVYGLWSGVAMVKAPLLLSIVRAHGKWTLFKPFIGGIPNNVRPWLIKIFISTEAVAVFNVAVMMVSAVKSAFPVSTLSALVPRELKDKERSQKIFSYGIKYLVVFSLIISTAAFFVGYPLIVFALPKYIASLPLFFIMLFSVPLAAFGFMLGTFLVALRKQKFIFYQEIVKVSFMLTMYAVLLPLYGLWGLAIERILTPIFHLTIVSIYIQKIKPGPIIEWRTLFRFDKKDVTFFQNAFGEFRKIIRKNKKTFKV